MATGWRYAADVGGTFTDVVLAEDQGRFFIKKLLSTPPDYELAVIEGLIQLLKEAGVRAEELMQIAHATTVATNAVLERKGARAGLLTTRGFRDVLELRRIRFPDTYNLFWEKPPPLVERQLRREVDERIGADGEILTPIDEAELRTQLRDLVDSQRIEALAVCFLNSYANPAHELAVGRIVRSEYPALPVSLSCDVLPEIREYERTSTTVLNAYLMPVLSRYLKALRERVQSMSMRAPIYVMQSSGGLMTARAAESQPIHLLESGCAAGVVAAAQLATGLELPSMITFDMGGTTAKACMIEAGQPLRAAEYEVGGSLSIASRLLRGGGHAVRVPGVDLAEVGAGGGSIVTVSAGGSLQVGPSSAGADPGPVCYGLGGTEPTVTDANVVLGYLNPTALLGGAFPIDCKAAAAAVERVAVQIGMSLIETAHGIHQIANAAMARAIRSISTERGRDPRAAALLAYGGNGPVHAAQIAESLHIKTIIVPPASGVFSGVGLLAANIERHYVKSHRRRLDRLPTEELQGVLANLESAAVSELVGDGFDRNAMSLARSADLHYQGQWHELNVALPDGDGRGRGVALISEAFETLYERTYGHRQEFHPVELVNIRVVATIPVAEPRLALGRPRLSGNASRRVYFGGPGLGLEVQVLGRDALTDRPRPGPMIIEEYDTTVVVPVEWSVLTDRVGNVVLESLRR